MNIASLRLQNQRLIGKKFKNPKNVVSYLGAVQAQDFYGAKWSLGLRMDDVTDEDIKDAFNKGEILRTHVMRPTWHFVSPEDIRWLLALTSPHVHAYNGYYYRKSGLNKDIFKKTNKIIEKALSGGQQLTRKELESILKKSKIPTDKLGLSYTIMQAELDGIICSGPRRGKQFTYVLLEELVPQVKLITRQQALKELTERYFISHGPATIQDFMWWSGLTVVDIRLGLEANNSTITSEAVNGKTYWFAKNFALLKSSEDSVFLLPTFDEYLIAYKNRNDVYEKNATHNRIFKDSFWNTIIINGKIVGSWKRTIKRDSVQIQPQFFRKLTDSENNSLNISAKQYAHFLNTNFTFSG